MLHGKRHGALVSSLAHPTRYVSRVSLSCGIVKVNFDASWKEGEVAVGYIIRNDTGNSLCAGTKTFSTNSVTEVELRAAWEGLCTVAQHLQFKNICLKEIL